MELTEVCLYVVLDAGAGIGPGSTLELGIGAATDVQTTGATVFLDGDGSIPGTTTFN